jgi:Trypsin
VAGGVLTGPNDFTNVASLSDPGVDGIFCSSVLVGPRQVITAAHCINGFGSDTWDRRRGNINVNFSDAVDANGRVPATVPDARRFAHTDLGSGNVPVLTPLGGSFKTGAEIADIAVVRIDRRMPNTITNPAPIAGLGTSLEAPTACSFGPTLYNTAVGFGRASLTGTVATPRNFLIILNVSRDIQSAGAEYVYNRTATAAYTSILPNDSGGPLFSADGSGTVCGVHSSYFPGNLKASFHTAVDSPTTLSFLQNAIIDPKNGRIFDTCIPGTDSDFDGFPDSCDNCPAFPNPDQADSDNDGLGDACDNCRLTLNADQTNSNFDFKTRAAPNGRGPVVTTLPRANDYLTNNYPGDACDTEPLTLLKPARGSYARSERPSSRFVQCKVSTVLCPNTEVTLGDGKVCDMSEGNRLDLTSILGRPDGTLKTDPAADRTVNANTRALRCACLVADNDADCAGIRCPRPNLGNPATGTWKKMRLLDDSKTAVNDRVYLNRVENLNERAFVRTTHVEGLGRSVLRAAWDYGSETDLIPLLPATIVGTRTSAELPSTNILAWSWVRNFSEGTPFGELNPPPATTAAATGATIPQNVRQNLQRMIITESIPAASNSAFGADRTVNPCKPPNYWPTYETGCLECKKRWVAYRKDELINPTILGIGQRERVVTMDANILRATTDPNTVLVVGSDEAKWATGQKRKGVIVNRAYPLFVANVTNTMTADPPNWGSPSLGTGTQLRFVMSQRRQDVAFFNRKQTDGSTLQGYYVFDLDTQAMRYEFFNGSTVIDNIQSVTYRAEDDAYYFLEGAPVKPSLYRLPRGENNGKQRHALLCAGGRGFALRHGMARPLRK